MATVLTSSRVAVAGERWNVSRIAPLLAAAVTGAVLSAIVLHRRRPVASAPISQAASAPEAAEAPEPEATQGSSSSRADATEPDRVAATQPSAAPAPTRRPWAGRQSGAADAAPAPQHDARRPATRDASVGPDDGRADHHHGAAVVVIGGHREASPPPYATVAAATTGGRSMDPMSPDPTAPPASAFDCGSESVTTAASPVHGRMTAAAPARHAETAAAAAAAASRQRDPVAVIVAAATVETPPPAVADAQDAERDAGDDDDARAQSALMSSCTESMTGSLPRHGSAAQSYDGAGLPRRKRRPRRSESQISDLMSRSAESIRRTGAGVVGDF
jgi:hypothetical protein